MISIIITFLDVCFFFLIITIIEVLPSIALRSKNSVHIVANFVTAKTQSFGILTTALMKSVMHKLSATLPDSVTQCLKSHPVETLCFRRSGEVNLVNFSSHFMREKNAMNESKGITALQGYQHFQLSRENRFCLKCMKIRAGVIKEEDIERVLNRRDFYANVRLNLSCTLR